ncbi:UDP-glucose 4-epimerase [[Pantoea] beijingensis]|uniref:UDP-glucose 4-epimerase n=1 Tax=[Pantoea] beijingensis TaxID=1324864 RepID=A0A443IAN7_9GAMM|nr:MULTISPECIES: UDP-glucose 4-epimerase GalE [Erwiniaceae]RWR01202.1 UDP-glucose 4-epimerase [[Pantoea] beijingensis]
MTILVTGGAGYIGSHTLIALAEANSKEKIIVIDNYANSSIKVNERVQTLAKRSFFFHTLDVCNLEGLREIFQRNNIHTIIHFAGLKSVSQSIHSPLEYYDNNFTATINILKCMKEYNVNKIIFSSSATVYGPPEFIPLNENAKVGGTTNPYGSSKLFCEQLLKDFTSAYSDKTVINLRYFNPVGAHESGVIGEDPCGIPNNLIPFIYQVAIGKLPALKVYGTDYPTHDGTGVRDYIHVMDLAEGHVAALRKDPGPGFYTYNLGTGKGYSVLDVVNTFKKISGTTLNVEMSERRKGDVAECWSDPNKANTELNWKAQRDLATMLADGWKWQQQNPDGYI